MNLLAKKKKDDGWFKPGGIFDARTYAGTVRGILFFSVLVYVGWYIDEIGRWLWHQFGDELLVSPAKERWHRIVVISMCGVSIGISVLNLFGIFIKRRRQAREAQIALLQAKAEVQNET